MMKSIAVLTLVVVVACLCMSAKKAPCYLNGFSQNALGEQHMTISNVSDYPDVRMVINAPSPDKFDRSKKTALVFYALPNGNTIEWTAGKRMQTGDDWHYNIQNVGAQMRFVRNTSPDYNWVVVYVQCYEKSSWPTWARNNPDKGKQLIQQMTDSVRHIFAPYHPVVMLNGHSGGGRFIFDFISGVKELPSDIERIAFLDSSYGYEDSLHLQKLTSWLKASDNHYLDVIAYCDSVVIYDGKPVVSPTGGTWYRSRKMQRDMLPYFTFKTQSDTVMIKHDALDGRLQFRLKGNADGHNIYHTVLVERNGLIHSLLSGTPYENKGYEFWGERAYNDFIFDEGY